MHRQIPQIDYHLMSNALSRAAMARAKMALASAAESVGLPFQAPVAEDAKGALDAALIVWTEAIAPEKGQRWATTYEWSPTTDVSKITRLIAAATAVIDAALVHLTQPASRELDAALHRAGCELAQTYAGTAATELISLTAARDEWHDIKQSWDRGRKILP